MKNTRVLHLALALATAALSFATTSFAVGTQRLELRRGEDFKGGELSGVAVDSRGRVRAGFNLGDLPVAEATSIWSALEAKDGSILFGTGNEGKLFRLQNGAVTLVGQSKGLTIAAIAEGWDGPVVGTMPDASLLKLQAGKLVELTKLKGAEHIWALAFDAKNKVLYAGTGPEGKVFRVSASGEAQVYFDADEQHIMSLALASDGRLFAGASDKAKLYEISGPGRASVLYDFGRTEVRAIAVSPSNEIYAIANELKGSASQGPRRAQGDSAGPVAAATPTRGKGTLYRFSAAGQPEQLLDDKDEHYTSLALGKDGRPYVGTGAEGRIYSVDESHSSILVADSKERQISALLLAGKSQVAFGSDPAVVHAVRGVGGADAVWTSKAFDLALRAKFGQMSWQSSGVVELSTRSGNTAEPDKTWSDWTAALAAPGLVLSPPARYLQIRARFNRDPNAVLSDIVVPFVTDNLRHVITAIEVDPAQNEGVTQGNGQIKGSGGPIAKRSEQRVQLKWRVDNPDSDELRYRLQYRLIGTGVWYELLKPGEKLRQDNYTWDTSDLPEGRYRVRVVATDEFSNPPALVQRYELESSVVLVDNTAPTLVELTANGRQLRGIATDGVGPIARIEAAIAGSDEWVPFTSSDGIFDEQREEFDLNLSSSVPAGPVLLSVRVYDQAGNFVVRSVPLK